jgi:hypothetical protein
MEDHPDIMIVGNKDLMQLARRLSHGISKMSKYSAGPYTFDQFKHSEAGVSGKQPIVFLGLNQIARDYLSELPERFRDYGTKCFFGGALAILEINTPQLINRTELDALKSLVDGYKEEFRNAKEEAGAKRDSEQSSSSDASVGIGMAIGGFLWGGISGAIASGLGLFKLVQAYKMSGVYRKLQIEYVLSRFLKEEFNSYIAGVEEVGGRVF